MGACPRQDPLGGYSKAPSSLPPCDPLQQRIRLSAHLRGCLTEPRHAHCGGTQRRAVLDGACVEGGEHEKGVWSAR